MARVAGHLSVEDLEAGFRSARDPTAARHFQVIWLLARGHTIAGVAAVTSFVPRWIEQLVARYMFDPGFWWCNLHAGMEGGAIGQVLHGSTCTTEATRRAIQHSQESLRTLAKRHGGARRA